ncbi:RsmB/NOP family class I SAM-dependent RNA methyltransferase [Algimonas arctica]|nr:RsmB/NOP family class I SAM-dependent RNA methyltransferase [Algimonas arctica]
MSDTPKNSSRPSRPSSGGGGDRRGPNKTGGKPGAKSGGKPGGRPENRSGGKSGGGGYKGGSGGSGGGYKGKGTGSNDRKTGSGETKRAWPRPVRQELTNAQRARKAAAMAVADVMGRGFRLESSLAKNPAIEGLDPRDRAFARAIGATTLRRLGQIDAVLAPLLKTPPPGRVQAYLQTAVAQMVFMDVAPHAAVGDTVTLVKADEKSEPFSGLVNAVLRKVAETGKADAAKIPPIRNFPGWLRSEWTRLYGKAAVRRMALLLATSPPLDLSVKNDPDGWAKKLGGTVVGGKTVRLDVIGNVTALEGFKEGEWWAQDISASLPARVLEQACGGFVGKRVADLCAAPGGKTMQLCAMGGDVTAFDLSEARTERLKRNLDRTQLDATIVMADLTEYTPEKTFDAVLLDAPCSSTGTFRRHPDVIHNRRERDITPLTRLQDTLLKHAAKCVSPGGTLLYSVCSLQEREAADRVRKFLKAMPDFGLVKLAPIPGLDLPEGRIDGGMIRLLPSESPDGRGMDGFFIAVLRRADKTDAKET